MRETMQATGGRDQSETARPDARIQAICDQLHRLEALVAVTVAVSEAAPVAEESAERRRLGFFRVPLEWE